MKDTACFWSFVVTVHDLLGFLLYNRLLDCFEKRPRAENVLIGPQGASSGNKKLVKI